MVYAFVFYVDIVVGQALVLGAYILNRVIRVRVRCDGCDGTGLCAGNNIGAPHSCCGDCSRAWVPASWVPDDFEGTRCEPHERLRLLDHEREGEPSVLIGTGWVWGSPWRRLRLGGPRKKLGARRG